jgi:hypothetical protein
MSCCRAVGFSGLADDASRFLGAVARQRISAVRRDVAQMNLTAVPVSDDDLWLQRTPPTRGLEYPFARSPHALPARASNAGPRNRLPVASPE